MNDSSTENAVIGCVLAFVFVIVLVTLTLLGIFIVIPTLTPAAPAARTTLPAVTHAGPPDSALYTWQPIADDFDSPVFVTHAGDGSGRLFVGEQGGMIWVIPPDGALLTEPFLDMRLLTSPDVMRGTYSERGLLSMAFDPDHATNGIFYLSYTDRLGDSVIARMQVSEGNPDRADHDSAVIVLTQTQPYYDHNGGQIAFGPDGYLYIGIGDGGSIDDPQRTAQNPLSLLGKVLRIDVRGQATYAIPPGNPFVGDAAYLPEIWAMGFRNPWRFSFDRATGDLYIGDVGQWTWEEVNMQPAGGAGGLNYGWNVFEGDLLRAAEVPPGFVAEAPVLAYDHTVGCAISGGYVYRGAALPALDGYYLYGDYCSGQVWAGWRDAAGAWHSAVLADTDYNITSFGEDEAGELYLADYKGVIARLIATTPDSPIAN